MDFGALKDDVKKVLKLLTPELQLAAAELFKIIGRHMPEIEKVGPQAYPILSNHIMAAAGEFAMGMIDKDGCDKALREAFAESGIIVPTLDRANASGPAT
jgi:hypothetical protein